MSTGEAFRKILESVKTVLFTLSAVFLTCFVAWASGITVPAGSRLNVDSGELHVETDSQPGSVRNHGVIRTTTGTIRLSGDWTIYGGGSYEPGTGKVVFSGAGTQTIIVAPSGPGPILVDSFYDLTHESGSILQVQPASNPLNITGTFSNLDGEFRANAMTMNVQGNWVNISTVNPSFVPGGNAVNLIGGDQEIQGETTFYDLNKHLTSAQSRQLVFPSGLEQTVTDHLALLGYDASNLLALHKSAGVAQAMLKLQNTGTQDIRFVDVYDNNASGRTLIGRQSPDKNNPVRDNTTNWQFGNITITWDGAQDDHWDNPYNWSLGVVPESGDSVVIPYDDGQAIPTPLLHQPVLRDNIPDPVTVGSLDIMANASLTLNGHNMTVQGAVTNTGTIVLDGNETFRAGSIDGTVGTFKYVGLAGGTLNPADISSNFIVGGSTLHTYHALIVDEADPANPDNFVLSSDLTVTTTAVFTAGTVTLAAGKLLQVDGQITVNGGALNAQAGNMNVKDFVLSSGSFSAPDTALTFTVSGNFTRSGGAFNPNQGTVTLDGVDQGIYTAGAGVGFYGLSKQAAGAATLTFEAGNTFLVSHKLTLTGPDAATLLNIDSSIYGSSAFLNLAIGGMQDIRNVYVADNNADGGLLLVGQGASSHGDRTSHWLFGSVAADLVWDGTPTPLSLSHTAWDEPSNWDLGFVPRNGIDRVRIPLLPDQPHLTAGSGAVNLLGLTLEVDASLYTDGHGLTVSGPFSNDGRVYLYGNEAVNITQDINSGAFVYWGDGSGTPYTLTVPATFFDLRIQPPLSGTPSVFTPSVDMTIYGSLSITGASFDASAHSLDLRQNFIMTGGAFKAPGLAETFTVTGNFTQTTAAGFNANGGTVTFNATSAVGPTDQVITGTTTFSGFSKRVPAGAQVHQLTLASGGEQIVTRDLDLGGIAGNPLQLASTTPGVMANLQLKPAGLQHIEYMVVVDSNAYGTAPLPPDPAHAITLVARSSLAADSSNYQNWKFGTTEVVWTGAFDTNWNDARNWDLGLVPQNGTPGVDGDDVRIPDVPNKPHLTGPIDLHNMTLEVDASVYLGGFDMTLTGALSNNGDVILQGKNGVLPQHIEIHVPDTDHGTFTYTGDNSGAPVPLDIYVDGAIYTPRTYFNLVIADAGAPLDTFVPGGALDVKGGLTVTSGTLDVSNVPVTVDGAFLLNGGTFVAPNTTAVPADTLTVHGDWTNTSGTFTPNGGNVTLSSLNNVANSITVSGNTTFYDLTVVGQQAGRTVYFQPGSDQTVAHVLDMHGDPINKLVLEAVNIPPGNPADWMLTILSGTPIVNNVDVRDSTAVFPPGNPTLERYILALNSIDQKSGGVSTNTNWVFADLSIITPTQDDTFDPGSPIVVDVQPTIIGRGVPGKPVTLLDMGGRVIATALVDTNGNFRVVAGQDGASLGVPILPLLVGPGNWITPTYNNYPGNRSSDIAVVALNTTTPAQVPVIDTPHDQDRLSTPLPTITGRGKPNAPIIIVASNPTDGLLLTLPPDLPAAEGTVAPDGTFSLTLTRSLKAGSNFVSVIVDGTSSRILEFVVNNIRGTVFDAQTDKPIRDVTVALYNANGTLAAPGVDISPLDVNPIVTGVDGKYFFFTLTGPYYFKMTAVGYDYPTKRTNDQLPVDRNIYLGSRGETFSPAGMMTIDQPMDPNPSTFRVEKKANKTEARVGEVVTYTVTIENLLENTAVHGAKLVDVIPPGFKYMSGRVQLDGIPLVEPEGNRPLWFDTGDFAGKQKKTLRYQLVIGSGVVPGGYENSATMRYTNNSVLSNRASATVNIILDPLFDAGTVFGKIFYDWNENGRQDNPEYLAEDRMQVIEGPVPNVTLVMEDGTVVTTDANGQFSIPALLPGRHLLRLDERSLPPGAYLTTDKVQVVDITPGSIVKVNFGVNMDNAEVVGKDAVFFQKEFAVEQAVTPAKPRLNIKVFNDNILLHNNTVIEQIEFRIFTNYAPFLVSWQLDVIDTDTKKLVRSFKGTRGNIYDPVFWDGRDASGKYLRPDFHYAYVLKVQDAGGKWDETGEQVLVLKAMTDEEMIERQRQRSDKEKTDEASARAKKYQTFLMALAQGNALKTQNIWVKGDTVVLKATAADVRQVRVLKNGVLFTEVPVLARNGLTARELLDGGTEQQALPMEVILPDGDYELEVVSAQGPGEGTAGVLSGKAPVASSGEGAGAGSPATVVEPVAFQTAHYKKPLKVGQDYLMFVAMGDGKVGYNMDRGNIEPVRTNEEYKRGFYTQGKLAYYLKGKIKGKYLVTSSFDTERQRKEALRAFRSEEYYPVYGDASTVNYDATNTEGPLYLAVDWDKSQAIWGNYAVAFNNVEFANYTRSLYGGKLDYKSVATTDYGDPTTNVVVFHAEVRQRSAHNELLATGGSLYYFKHQDIVQATDKVRLEVRDGVTGLVKATTDMKSGVDYEMDYANGRVLFWRPVSMLAGSDRLISNSLLSGDPIYVVSDYEYFVHDKIAEGTQGVRVAQAVGKNVVVGGTYVSETQANRNYQLTGQDVTAHLGKDATVQAEYAQTTSDAQNNYISTDGGITFTELASADNANGKAYGIKQDARLFDRIGLKSYYKWIGDGFSTGGTTSQQGKELTGLAMTFDLTPVTRLTASRDIQRLIEHGNLQTSMQVGASETTTTLVQLVHDARRLRLTEEFQSVEVKGAEGVKTTQSNVVSAAAQAEYALDEKTNISLRQEATLSGTSKRATTIGLKRQVTDKLSMIVEEALSTDGTATKLGATANVTPKLALNTDFTLAQTRAGATAQTISLGGKGQINDNTTLEATAGVTQTGAGVNEQTAALGLASKVDENTNVKLGVESTAAADATKARQALVFEGTKTGKEGRETTAGVKVEDRAVEGKTTVITAGEKGQISPTLQMASERSFGFGANGQDMGDSYKIARTKDGRTVETSYTRKFADTQTQHSDSNIFALSGDVNDRVAVLASLEKGRAMNLDGSIYNRIALAGSVGYVQKDQETGKVTFQSSTKAEARFDQGTTDRQQYVFYQSAEGKLNEQTTVKGKFSYSLTRNMDTKKAEAGYKEIMLGGAYRPVAMDRVNLFGEYTYKENQGPEGQTVATDVQQTKMHVLTVGAGYELNDKWELIEKLAMRIMDEKVTGFAFAKTHTWLLVNRANYRINEDWKIGAEYRILTVQEAKDQKRGLLIEAVHSVNDNVELGVGYNFTNFVDDLTNLSYTVQGPFIRMTGKLYDQSPEERARSRAKWIEHRVAIYAQRMLKKEVEDPNSKIMVELNRMYQTAKAAQQHGKYEESREIYKNIITTTQMMYEEAAQFVRQHIAYEENIYNAYQRAQEYYDKGEFWQARKLWEKIVEEASKAVLE